LSPKREYYIISLGGAGCQFSANRLVAATLIDASLTTLPTPWVRSNAAARD